MDGIHCPMCGEVNPPELEICQFCEARLKPLIISTPAQEPEESQDYSAIHPPDPEDNREGEDWLSGLREDGLSSGDQADEKSPLEESERAEDATSDFDAEAADWLSRLKESSSGEVGETSPLTTPEVEKESKDVFQGEDETTDRPPDLQSKSEIPSESQVDEKNMVDPKEDVPEWLERIRARREEDGEGFEPQGEDMPLDWISGLAKETGGEEQAEALSNAEFGELPEREWTDEESPGEPLDYSSEDEEGELEAIHTAELPDWLSEERIEEEFEEFEPESDLVSAELPSWLEAMRPPEDVPPPTPIDEERSSGKVESAGPLAGLSDVISAEPEIARILKPRAYSVKLQVSESQQGHAKMITRLLEEESTARPALRLPTIAPQNILRWLIALVLFSAILWPVVTEMEQAMLPALPAEVAEVNRLINELPAESRVLLAFDYQPGLSGELDAIASPVVDHLMMRGTYLTLVSTSPSGPVVAERFLVNTQAIHNYTNGIQYINLGYIPGGPAGLLSFAQNPVHTMPYTLDGKSAWGREGSPPLMPLLGIQSIEDFAMIVVISEDADTARAWIEQVGPYLELEDLGRPLVVIASAQAEPLLRPYYDAQPRQIAGLVTGMRDGAAYVNATGRGELPRLYWDAFGFGLFVAGALIIVGGLFNLASTALFDQKEQNSVGE